MGLQITYLVMLVCAPCSERLPMFHTCAFCSNPQLRNKSTRTQPKLNITFFFPLPIRIPDIFGFIVADVLLNLAVSFWCLDNVSAPFREHDSCLPSVYNIRRLLCVLTCFFLSFGSLTYRGFWLFRLGVWATSRHVAVNAACLQHL